MENTPYDDVFRTLLNDCKSLILPVLNEIFGEHYSGDEQIEFSKNEFFLPQEDGTQEKRVTDSCFVTRSDNKEVRYHLECESDPDSSILIRIFEYDAQIALNDRIEFKDRIRVKFPRTAIVALRASGRMPDQMVMEIEMPDGAVSEYAVSVLKTQDYSLEEIFNKKLWFLLPFYLFSYEKQFKKLEADETELNSMLGQYIRIKDGMIKLVQDDKMNYFTAETLRFCINKVAENLANKHKSIVEGVIGVMGGQILDHPAKAILRQGEAQGKVEGEEKKAREVAIKMYRRGDSLEYIADMVGFSKETVEKWLGLVVAN